MSDLDPEKMVKKWLKIHLDCPEMIIEGAVDLLAVLSGSGVEQTPPQHGSSGVNAFFVLDGMDTAQEQKEIKQRVQEELNNLFQIYEQPAPVLGYQLLDDEDWATSWQQYFKPFAIIPGLVIKPSWETYARQRDELVIEMDPGMAFGTGQHASTKLALSLIRASFQEGRVDRVLDIGTGTGILAMAAALFGAKEVIATDNDPVAVQVAGDNIAHNRLESIISVSGRDLSGLEGEFTLICANIIHGVLVEMAPQMSGLLEKQGWLVLAGILQGEQEENIIKVYGQAGLRLEQTLYEDEWVALLLRSA